MERGGSENNIGIPVAFVESAWRRYTKHSKNKVQEIEAAVVPVSQTFSRYQPFCGAVLSGEFTQTALSQLKSKGFFVLHIPYKSILAAFNELGIDASSKDGKNGTTERQFKQKIAQWESLQQPRSTELLLHAMHKLHSKEIRVFVQQLENSIVRKVIRICLTVLRGNAVEYPDVSSAIKYLIEEERNYRVREDGEERERFEIQVRFNNQAKIEASFPTRAEAIGFLRSFE